MLVCVVGVLDMEMAYPLVNMQKNCGKAPCFMAKSTINGQFSIVTSKCRRVYPLVDNAFLLLCVTYFQMVFVQQAMFVYQLDGCIENDFKRPHPKFFLKLMISEQKKSWPETQAGFTLNVPWKFPRKCHRIPWIYGARHREIARSMVWDLRMAARIPRWNADYTS